MARPLSGDREAVFAALTHAAGSGLPCPTDPELSRIGGGGSRFGYETIGWLKRAGRIEVEHFGNCRRVTIVATGARTHYERPSIVARIVDLPPRVDRDPCPRCGVRRDVGCAHTGKPLGFAFGLAA